MNTTMQKIRFGAICGACHRHSPSHARVSASSELVERWLVDHTEREHPEHAACLPELRRRIIKGMMAFGLKFLGPREILEDVDVDLEAMFKL